MHMNINLNKLLNTTLSFTMNVKQQKGGRKTETNTKLTRFYSLENITICPDVQELLN